MKNNVYFFSQFEILHLLYLIGFFLIFIGLIIIVTSLYNKQKKDFKQSIIESNRLTIVKIDLLNKRVYLFSLKDLQNAQEITLNEYLSHFDEENIPIVNTWIMNQFNKQTIESDSKEVTNFQKKKKKYTKEILVCTKKDFKTHTLHLKHYSSTYNKNINYSQNIKSDYEIEQLFFKLSSKSLTNIATINFFNIKNNASIFSNPINRQQLIDIILKYCSKNIYMSLLKPNEVVLIMLNQKQNDITALNKIRESIKSYLSLNNYLDDSFNIAIYQHKGISIDFNSCIKKVRLLQNYLYDTYQYTPSITFYYNGGDYPLKQKHHYKNSLSKSIENSEFRLNITPFVNVTNSTIDFYKVHLQAINASIFTNKYQDFHDFLLEEYIYDYIEIFQKKINATFGIKKNNITLLLETPLSLLETFLKIDVTSFTKYHDYILCLSLKEIEALNDDNYLSIIKKLKQKGVKFCLSINHYDNPKESLINELDYILFMEHLISKKPNIDFFLQSNLFKLFSERNIKLICEGVNDFESLETLISNNVKIFSGKCLDIKNDIDASVSKRISLKLESIVEKYN